MEITDSFIRSYNVKNNAKRYIDSLAIQNVTYGSPDLTESTHNILCHLDDCINNPTKGFLLRYEAFDRFIRQSSDTEIETYYSNIDKALECNRIKIKTEELRQQVQNLYPKTQDLRLELICKERVKPEVVVPKMSYFQKLFFKFARSVKF